MGLSLHADDSCEVKIDDSTFPEFELASTYPLRDAFQVLCKLVGWGPNWVAQGVGGKPFLDTFDCWHLPRVGT